MKHIIGKAALVGAGILLVSGSALAVTPYPNVITSGNYWRITSYTDYSSTHPQQSTQTFCFGPASALGMGITGSWKSPSFAGWDGWYYQEGDEFRMVGDYANNVGHDHISCQMISNTLAGCTWDEWREDGSVRYWTNAKMERIGTCTYSAVAADMTAESATSTAANPATAPVR